MTKLGKILVLVNVALSFTLMAWALAAFTNRIDWSDKKAQGEEPAGELRKRIDEIDELWKGFRPAEAAWREPRAAIFAMEARRPKDRQWYARELENLRTGDTDKFPIRSVIYNAGLPALDPRTGLPQMADAKDRNSQPLKSLSSYDRELNDLRTALLAEVKRLHEGILEDTRLTVQLVGEIDDTTKKILAKGLRQRIIDERDKAVDLVKEQDIVRPLLINAYVESQLILKRADSLKARIQELEHLGTGVAER